ncbi:hypothetical protein CONPUDRAFT_151499 [Coniophora puteana RWD-64-598 SS2]|uniref:Uncharacterized protein n=1 Tax=Coniophora puteana (strain RWD-64-598) TaxID=741705 RepID=A0A5M3N0R5_CONPW|nr:uncharacterized protein CONPUDRAFT_151499 [Coniophora puteana RWD-64-598 SS2]EIW84481.1 hypothetical protein CONPUDRAFT_151499 [Coniophora puteana RWD-64-598 SS2]
MEHDSSPTPDSQHTPINETKSEAEIQAKITTLSKNYSSFAALQGIKNLLPSLCSDVFDAVNAQEIASAHTDHSVDVGDDVANVDILHPVIALMKKDIKAVLKVLSKLSKALDIGTASQSRRPSPAHRLPPEL